MKNVMMMSSRISQQRSQSSICSQCWSISSEIKYVKSSQYEDCVDV